ncbi:MAG: ethylbenzene dehydrogenase-related protein [Pirellula sp.]
MNRVEDNNRLLLGIVGGAALILLTMITSIFLVSRRPVVVVVPGNNNAANVAPAPGATAPTGIVAVSPAAPLSVIAVSRVSSAPKVDNPLDQAWDRIANVEVELAPQQVAQPVLEKGTVAKLRVQAVRDDQRYVWRLSWDKAAIADHVDVAQFTDAVAMQFPLVDGAPYTMGGPNLPVRMLYWKAAWQKDIDKGFQGVTGIHPNTDNDLYWFAESKNASDRHAADGSIDNENAKQWMVAAKSGNPMADYHRKHPVEEMTAHGFGSGTHIADTPTRGQGVWQDGKWFVVFDRPIKSDDPLVARFNTAPDKQLIAFAVWDGDNANRGGKKQITNWLPMRIAQ